MERNGTKFIKSWLSTLLSQYEDFTKTKNYRCRIIGMQSNKDIGDTILQVMISGIKNQIVEFSPKKLVMNDDMLSEFSSSDVRAITFLALKEVNNNRYCHSITGQDFENGKTFFIVKNIHDNTEFRKSAHELYANNELLNQFNNSDIKNIISTAIQEQAIEDFL